LLQFQAQYFQHFPDAGLTSYRQSPENGPADADRRRPQRQSFYDVGAPADSSIH
jgi:hypothetical protein